MTEIIIFILGVIVGFVNMGLLVQNTGRLLSAGKEAQNKFPMLFSYFLRFFLAGLFLYSAVKISGICLIAGLAGYLVPLLLTVIFPFQAMVSIKKSLVKG